MICFIIPVKSKQVANDWMFFSSLFERTLKSVCAQIDDDFEVIVACHEVPQTGYTHPKLHFLEVDFPPPKQVGKDPEEGYKLKNIDKANKILKAYEYANENFEVDYFMVVDSDDCIHWGISEFVNSNKEGNNFGWVIKSGYFVNEGSQLAWLNKNNFDVRCGSCLIVTKDFFKNLIAEEPYLFFYHNNPAVNTRLQTLPFPGAVYSMANGDNIFMTSATVNGMFNQPKLFTSGHIKSLLLRIKRYRPRFIGGRFKKEFNFYQLS